MKKVFTTRFIAEAGIIAAVYFAITMAVAYIAFGPLQLRISEALCILPFFTPAAVPGLFIGCLLANLAGSPLGPYDILFGSLATLLASFLTYIIGRISSQAGRDTGKAKWLLPLPAVLVNAFVVAGILNYYLNVLYWESALYVAIGQTLACYALGMPLFFLLNKHKDKLFRR